MTAPEVAADVVIHLITFDAYETGVEFLERMRKVVIAQRTGAQVHLTKAATAAAFEAALRHPADLVIVSAHGPAYKIGEQFEAVLSAGFEDDRWVTLRQFGTSTDARIGARAGIIWDVCNAGRPGFVKELEPLLAWQIASVGVIGLIDDPYSTDIMTKILKELLAPGVPPITPETVKTAAAEARIPGVRLTCKLLGVKEMP
jgi:hypothetical protein